MKRIYITGSRGYLGEKLIDILKKDFIVNGSDKEIDITDTSKIRSAIKDFSPDVLIHTAGLTNIYECEENPSKAHEINVVGTINLSDIAEEQKIKMVYISTDYVFDGKKGYYNESDKPNPISVYGKTKKLAEDEVLKLKDYLIIRSGTFYGYNKNNKKPVFVNRVIEKLSKREPFFAALDQVSSPTLIDDLVNAIIFLIRENKVGIWNIVGPEAKNRYDLALDVASIFGLNQNLVRKSNIEKMGLKNLVPKDCSLDTDKIKKVGLSLNPSQAGLSLMKGQMYTNENKTEVSSGVIFYTKTEENILIFLIKHRQGHWGFPKGRVEPGESFEECAKREIFEEVGIKLKNIDIEKTIKSEYRYGNGIKKEVNYFIMKANKFKPSLNDELVSYEWVPLLKAFEKSEFPAFIKLLKRLTILLGVA